MYLVNFDSFYVPRCQHDDGYTDGRSQIKVHTDERTQFHTQTDKHTHTHTYTPHVLSESAKCPQ